MVADRIDAIHRPWLNRVMIVFTHLGSGGLIWWLTLCLPMVITVAYRRLGITIALSMGVTYVLGEKILKHLVGRIRPSESIDEGEMLVRRPKDHSFPSGHTACSFTVFAVTVLTCPVIIWAPVLLGAMTIAFSRIYLRVHYVSDVAGGVILGLLSGWACYLLSARFFLYG